MICIGNLPQLVSASTLRHEASLAAVVIYYITCVRTMSDCDLIDQANDDDDDEGDKSRKEKTDDRRLEHNST